MTRAQLIIEGIGQPTENETFYQSRLAVIYKWGTPQKTKVSVIGYADGGTFELWLMTVADAYQGKGVGTEVLRWLRKRFRTVEVFDATRTAMPFWTKMLNAGLVDKVNAAE